MTHRVTDRRKFRLIASLSAVAVVAAGTATVALAAKDGEPAPLGAFVAIEKVGKNVVEPKVGKNGASGVFRVDCGTNESGKFSADNPVAQPGLKHGAQHVHDFVGNQSISAESTDESLVDAETSCRNGDRSSYFWPVVRINTKANPQDVGSNPDKIKENGPGEVACPGVAQRLPAVPQRVRDEIIKNLQQLAQQLREANDRVARAQNPGDPNFVNNTVLGPLRSKRVATLERIANALSRSARKPNLTPLADCDLRWGHGGGHGGGNHSSKPHKFAADGVLQQAEQNGAEQDAATPTIKCPSVREALPGVPDQALDEVDNNLDQLDKQIAEANQRLVKTKGQGGPNFIDNAILGPLKDKRVATLDRIAIAIGRNAEKPQGLDRLAKCGLNEGDEGGNENNGGNNNGGNNNGGNNNGGATTTTAPPPPPLAAPTGKNLELVGNNGKIVRPAEVKIEYRGNATSKVTGMPKFLKMVVGDAKPTSRGPANARATWTCSGSEDRLSDKYVICPNGSKVMRVHDFAGCWDGKNADSANHRDHVRFADKQTGACPQGFKAIPQLRISISYNISRDIQQKGQYQLDAFPEENHNPFSDHNDFANVNSDETMAKIVKCVNDGRRCS
ncbi:DUF1996 domain-containing protein [Lentzea sp. BCCO 10_0061]|uniref:DUF1996 domain-containing protein n=1 Tax=Lentzea sokolovensis TaxID=3095429 RepID=A0ABU4VAJ2_9PSEU|nr:DUF1996 domain-containing protein [Lentzea sp. BCCO 10_0061]MDX8148794.1 DUF1996 domain-containing protein [Lentzea sp. BCCO 10_0061]